MLNAIVALFFIDHAFAQAQRLRAARIYGFTKVLDPDGYNIEAMCREAE